VSMSNVNPLDFTDFSADDGFLGFALAEDRLPDLDCPDMPVVGDRAGHQLDGLTLADLQM